MVLAILSICVGLVAPALNLDRFRDSLKAGTRQLSSALAQARNQAMTSGQRQVLLLDYSLGSQQERVCYLLVAAGEIEAQEPFSLREGDVNSHCLPYGLRIEKVVTRNDPDSRGLARIEALPNGLLQPGLIYMRDGERIQTIRIRPFQGHPEVLSGHPRLEELDQPFFGRGETSSSGGVPSE